MKLLRSFFRTSFQAGGGGGIVGVTNFRLFISQVRLYKNLEHFFFLLLILLLLLEHRYRCSFKLLVLLETHDLCVFAVLIVYLLFPYFYLEILLAATEAENKT